MFHWKKGVSWLDMREGRAWMIDKALRLDSGQQKDEKNLDTI